MSDREVLKAMLDRAGVIYSEESRAEAAASVNASLARHGFTAIMRAEKVAELPAYEIRVEAQAGPANHGYSGFFSALDFDESGALIGWSTFE